MRLASLFLSLLLLPLAAPSAATKGGGGYKSVARIKSKTRGVFRLVHPERWAVLQDERVWGEGDRPLKAWAWSLADLKEAELKTLELPIGVLYEPAQAKLFIDGPTWANRAGKKFASFRLELIHYDPEAGFADTLLRNDWKNRKTKAWKKRVLFLRWDLKTARIMWSVKLDEVTGNKTERYDHYLGYAGPVGEGNKRWFTVRHHRSDGDLHRASVRLLRFDPAKKKVSFEHRFDIGPSPVKFIASRLRTWASPDEAFFVFAEYHEKEKPPVSPAPQLHILKIADKNLTSLAVPPTPYGVAMDEAGKLVVASNQIGELWVYDLNEGKLLRKVKTIPKIHKLLRSPDGKKLFAFAHNRKFEIRAWPSLKRLARKKAAKLIPGQKWLSPEKATFSLDRRHLVLPPAKAKYGFAEREDAFILRWQD